MSLPFEEDIFSDFNFDFANATNLPNEALNSNTIYNWEGNSVESPPLTPEEDFSPESLCSPGSFSTLSSNILSSDEVLLLDHDLLEENKMINYRSDFQSESAPRLEPYFADRNNDIMKNAFQKAHQINDLNFENMDSNLLLSERNFELASMMETNNLMKQQSSESDLKEMKIADEMEVAKTETIRLLKLFEKDEELLETKQSNFPEKNFLNIDNNMKRSDSRTFTKTTYKRPVIATNNQPNNKKVKTNLLASNQPNNVQQSIVSHTNPVNVVVKKTPLSSIIQIPNNQAIKADQKLHISSSSSSPVIVNNISNLQPVKLEPTNKPVIVLSPENIKLKTSYQINSDQTKPVVITKILPNSPNSDQISRNKPLMGSLAGPKQLIIPAFKPPFCATPTSNSMSDNKMEAEMIKKQQRMIKNRESANQSRRKKKMHVANLESQIESCTKENVDLQNENQMLKEQIINLENENQMLKERVEYLENNKSPQLQRLLEDYSDEDQIFKKFSRSNEISKKKPLILFSILIFIGFSYSFSPFFQLSGSLPQHPIIIGSSSHFSRKLLSHNLEKREISENSNRTSPARILPFDASILRKNQVKDQLPLFNSSFLGLKSSLNKELLRSKQHESLLPSSDQKENPCTESNRTENHKLNLKLDWWISHHLKNDADVKKRKRKSGKMPPRFRNQPPAIYRKKKDLGLFWDAFGRENDTIYVIAPGKDHLLLPPLVKNLSSKTKLSLLFSAAPPNDTFAGEDELTMIKIDCEVNSSNYLRVLRDLLPRGFDKNQDTKQEDSSSILSSSKKRN